MSCALFAALVLLADAGASNGEGARTDLYGDPLPPGAVARLGTIRLRHANAEMTFSKDGKRLISCGQDGEVRIWDAATGELLRHQRLPRKPQHGEFRQVTALSPEGATVAVWHGPAVCLYDARTGAERGCLPPGNYLYPPLLMFSPGGEVLAAQRLDDRPNLTAQLLLWDITNKKSRCTVKLPPQCLGLGAVAFTADGRRLAGRENDKVHLWDAVTGEKKREHALKGSGSLAFSSDGKTLAVGTERSGEIYLLDAITFRSQGVLKVPARPKTRWCIDRLAFSPDGRLLAGAYRDWDYLTDACGVLLWDVKGLKEVRRLPGGFNARFAFTPDSRTLAFSDHFGSEIRLWDVASGKLRHERPGHGYPIVEALASSPDGKLLASGDGGAVFSLWDTVSSRLLYQRNGEEGLSACLFAPDGMRVITAGHRGALQVWDTVNGKEARRLAVGSPPDLLRYHAVGISGDGQRLLAITSEAMWLSTEPQPARLIIWNLARGERNANRPYRLENRALENKRGTRGLAHAALAPNGDRMTVWLGDRVGVSEVATESLRAVLPKRVGGRMVFSPEGRLLAAAVVQPKKEPWQGDDMKGLAVFEAVSGEEIFRKELAGLLHFAFAPDGRALVVADRQKLSVWDTDTGERLFAMAWPESILDAGGGPKVHSLVVLRGGRAATGMTEGDILVWNLAPSTWPTGKPVRALSRPELDALWSDLAGDARKAHRAVYLMAAAPAQSVLFLKDRLQSPTVDTQRVEKLMADLDGDSFTAREAASHELARLHYRVEPVLRRVLAGKPSLEVRRRLESILSAPKKPSPEDLRTLRAIAVLERIGTPESRRILEKLSGGAEACETREAKAALQRLKRR